MNRALAARLLGMVAFGAVVGAFFDGFHTHSNTTRYAVPWILQMAMWTPALFAFAFVSIGVLGALSFPAFELRRAVRTSLAAFLLLGVVYFQTGFGPYGNGMKLLVCLLASALYWRAFEGNMQSVRLGVLAAVLGPLTEIALTGAGAFSHLQPDVLRIPIWLPGLYLLAGMTAGRMGRTLLELPSWLALEGRRDVNVGLFVFALASLVAWLSTAREDAAHAQLRALRGFDELSVVVQSDDARRSQNEAQALVQQLNDRVPQAFAASSARGTERAFFALRWPLWVPAAELTDLEARLSRALSQRADADVKAWFTDLARKHWLAANRIARLSAEFSGSDDGRSIVVRVRSVHGARLDRAALQRLLSARIGSRRDVTMTIVDPIAVCATHDEDVAREAFVNSAQWGGAHPVFFVAQSEQEATALATRLRGEHANTFEDVNTLNDWLAPEQTERAAVALRIRTLLHSPDVVHFSQSTKDALRDWVILRTLRALTLRDLPSTLKNDFVFGQKHLVVAVPHGWLRLDEPAHVARVQSAVASSGVAAFGVFVAAGTQAWMCIVACAFAVLLALASVIGLQRVRVAVPEAWPSVRKTLIACSVFALMSLVPYFVALAAVDSVRAKLASKEITFDRVQLRPRLFGVHVRVSGVHAPFASRTDEESARKIHVHVSSAQAAWSAIGGFHSTIFGDLEGSATLSSMWPSPHLNGEVTLSRALTARQPLLARHAQSRFAFECFLSPTYCTSQ